MPAEVTDFVPFLQIVGLLWPIQRPWIRSYSIH